MSALITCRIYNAGVPATGLTPTIDIIRQSDSTVVIDDGAMTEVAQGFYQYEFINYDKAQLYFYAIDGGATLSDSDRYLDNINQLDSYGNKTDWGRKPEVIIDTQALAWNVWEEKTKDHNKEGTFGGQIQKPLSYDEIVKEVNKVKESINSVVNQIKIPKGLSKKDIYEATEMAIEEKLKEGVKEALDEYENKEERKEKPDHEPLNQHMMGLAGYLDGFKEELQSKIGDLDNKVNGVSETINVEDLIGRLKEMDIDKLVSRIEEADSLAKQTFEIQKKNKDEMDSFNKDILELKFTIRTLFNRLNQK